MVNGMQLFDMHSHILPNIDDGAKTLEDSLKLLSCLEKQGVTNVCLTPHFYTNEISIEDFMATMFTVGLGKHHQFNIGRVALEGLIIAYQIVDFINR